MSIINGRDGHVADRYHRECLSLLIPVLDQSNAALDAALFAATVILRVYEEISGMYVLFHCRQAYYLLEGL